MAFIDILVVLLLVGAGALAFSRMRHADRQEDIAGNEDARRLADEVRKLRARIHVLERALTDNHAGSDLSSEIERLRDR